MEQANWTFTPVALSGGLGESHPQAPADPGVTVSRHRALLILSSPWAMDPLPVREEGRILEGDPLPRPVRLLDGPQPPVLLPDPPHQVCVDQGFVKVPGGVQPGD